MKLSEAIRLGSMVRPQAFGNYYDADGSCAMGAALEAHGHRDSILARLPCAVSLKAMAPEWVWATTTMQTACPFGCLTCSSFAIAAHLNDYHRWTREAIADWIATIEPQEQPEPVAVLVSAELVTA